MEEKEQEKEIILKKYYSFCVDNFYYDPITLKKPRSIFTKSLTFKHQKTQLMDINLSKIDEIPFHYIYYLLLLLNQCNEEFKNSNKDIIHKLLTFIYEYIENKEDFNPNLSFNYYFEEIGLPFINSLKIQNLFKAQSDFNFFLLFNFILILSKDIGKELYENLYFPILNILALYDFFFYDKFFKR